MFVYTRQLRQHIQRGWWWWRKDDEFEFDAEMKKSCRMRSIALMRK